jgi:hypothetical protein
MQKRNVIILTIILGLGMAWWFFTHDARKNVPQDMLTSSSSTNRQESALDETDAQTREKSPIHPHSKSASEPSFTNAIREYVQKTLADPQYDWKQPISFYGEVVDETHKPVFEANVHFTWTDLSKKGTSEDDTKSDSDGLFSLHHRTGKRISVTVSKEGFYTTPSERLSSFEYANPADGLFSPDPNNPIVFHLRKKGVGVELITSQYGMSPDFPIHVPRDGTRVQIDLLQRKVGESGQIQISESKPEQTAWKQATSWSFRMEIPDGGFVEENEEFPFEAPETGYRSVVQFDFQQGQTNWATLLKKDFYIKFGNPPRYGRFQVQTGISYGGAILTYAINPSGSRNLEPAN